jgi:pseudouridine-5'-phosphate glycosidase
MFFNYFGWVFMLDRRGACCAQGVCVASYGQAEFPAFYSPSSGCRAPCQVNSPAEVAAVVVAAAKLRLRSGVVVGVPIPEQHMAEGAQIEGAIGRALAEAEEAGVKGNEVSRREKILRIM